MTPGAGPWHRLKKGPALIAMIDAAESRAFDAIVSCLHRRSRGTTWSTGRAGSLSGVLRGQLLSNVSPLPEMQWRMEESAPCICVECRRFGSRVTMDVVDDGDPQEVTRF
jgi:hypothetical protein